MELAGSSADMRRTADTNGSELQEQRTHMHEQQMITCTAVTHACEENIFGKLQQSRTPPTVEQHYHKVCLICDRVCQLPSCTGQPVTQAFVLNVAYGRVHAQDQSTGLQGHTSTSQKRRSACGQTHGLYKK